MSVRADSFCGGCVWCVWRRVVRVWRVCVCEGHRRGGGVWASACEGGGGFGFVVVTLWAVMVTLLWGVTVGNSG